MAQVEHVLSERRLLEACSHPFLIHLHANFQTPTTLHLLLSYIPGGELFSHLRRARRFVLPTAQFYASEIVLALEYLHNKGIVYRDLKPENLLLDERGHVRITDFGFAKAVGENERLWSLCGTPEYLSPEIIKSKGINIFPFSAFANSHRSWKGCRLVGAWRSHL
jgi:serine/threonine protein kinase